MIIKNLRDVPITAMHGSESVKKQIVIGPDDGSNEIVIGPDGTSPRHAHDFPYLVNFEAGNGVLTDEAGLDHWLQEG